MIKFIMLDVIVITMEKLTNQRDCLDHNDAFNRQTP